MLNLLYITNNSDIALLAEKAGVDRIWIDLETLGKEKRQKNLNTVKSVHSIDDIRRIAPLLTESDLLVRVNPWNQNSIIEINEVIEAGANLIMLPYWKTTKEVELFLKCVNGRCGTILLLETKEAVDCLAEVLKNCAVQEVHIGLNDLHLSYGYENMFLPFSNGMLDKLSFILKEAGIPFGIGGIGQFGLGLSPSPEELIAEHYRLGSTAVILSRTFCNAEKIGDLEKIGETLSFNVARLRKTEEWAAHLDVDELNKNHMLVCKALEG